MTEEEKARALNLAEQNLEAMEIYAHLLIGCADAFSESDVRGFARDCDLPVEEAYLALMTAAAGLRPDENPRHRLLAERYLRPAIRRLAPESYASDPYYRQIAPPAQTLGRWELGTRTLAPYTLFPCGDVETLPDGRELQPLGYFERPFPYPVLLQDGREWMTVTPNEIETMRADIAAARGRVAVFGLGLGYYAFMAARKETVQAVTVIEIDPQVIALFTKCLLPRFPCRSKIQIVQADAFDFLQSDAMEQFDFAYFDIWHDVSDGVPLYLRLRAAMARFPQIPCRYWIEQSMLIWLRGMLMEDFRAGKGPLLAAYEALRLQDRSLASMRALAPFLPIEAVIPEAEP